MKLLGLFILFLILIGFSLCVGTSSVGFSQLIGWLTHKTIDASAYFILEKLRLPRTIACLLVGANLGFAGALLQTLLKNPLAEPYTLGLSGGATLGAIFAILSHSNPAWFYIPLFAVAGCVLVTLLILKIAWRESFYSQRTLILSGVMISLFCGSLVVLLMSLFDPYQIQTSFFWMLGQVGTDRDNWWPLLAVALICALTWGTLRIKDLDRLLLGDDVAASLGTNVRRLRVEIILAACVLCAASVSVAGLVGFVGLLAPHLGVLLFRRQHRWFLPMSAVMGAFFLLFADIMGRSIGGDKDIPAGGFVALIGAPLLVIMMLRWERHART